jgi:hypothetical protein
VTDRGMNLVGEYCEALVVLYVTDCRDVTEKSLNRLREKEIQQMSFRDGIHQYFYNFSIFFLSFF